MNSLILLLALLGGNWSFPSETPSFKPQIQNSADRSLDKSIVVSAPVSDVWRAWTTSEGMREFMGVSSKIDLKFGGRFEILFDNNAPVGAQGSEGCQVLSFIRNKMLSFSWNAPPIFPTMRNQRSFVVLTFADEGGKTRVDLHHAGWGEGSDWDKVYAYFDKAWTGVLGALKARFDDGPTKDQNPPALKPSANDLAPLDKMAGMIGGTWRGEVKGPDGPLAVEFTYKRHGDGKGIVGEGVIGNGSKQPLWVHSQFGWDPVAKSVYYFDTHDSETLYFGHISLDKGDMVFTFSPIGMLPQVFQSRVRLVDRDTYQAIIKDAHGAELVGFTLKRQR